MADHNLDEETMDEFLRATDQISNVLYRFEKRRKDRDNRQRKILKISFAEVTYPPKCLEKKLVL